MTSMHLLDAERSLLLIVDMQTRLAKPMDPDRWSAARDAAVMLARAAAELDLPVIVTRQYPRGLGDTDPAIVEALPGGAVTIDKMTFSACDEPELTQALEMTGRSQVLVCGMETHVCVLQTVAGLAAGGYRPFVAADAVCSRDPAHITNALDRMRAAGIAVTNRESALFEWLRDARHERFKTISGMLR